MKSHTNLIAMVFVAQGALGVGVIGTWLWAASRPKPPVVAATDETFGAALAPPEVEKIVGLPGLRIPPNNRVPLPPAQLTEGMSPRQATLTLANWYYDHHQHELAVENFRRTIELGVTHPSVRTDLGNALRLNGQPNEALEQYQLAQKQDPTHEQSLFNQGALYAVSFKNPRKGIEIWRAYLKRFPTGPRSKQARALIAKFAEKQ